jgi:ribose 5-phosphate isomerase A
MIAGKSVTDLIDPEKDKPLGLQWCRPITNREAKEIIATEVADRARPGQIIGAGSGSTSFLTVLALGARAASEGLNLRIVPSSLEIELACYAVDLEVCNFPLRIDWCFDGADEVDPTNRLIKGRGGALHRERQVFAASVKRVVVADSSKTVRRLGEKFPVPVEVEPAWVRTAFDALSKLNHVSKVNLRMGIAKDGPVFTESGRLLLDVTMTQIDVSDEQLLLAVPGVCCTGIFSNFEFERISA